MFKVLGIISDTHEDRANAIPHIVQDFKKRGVELVIHCGDIEPQHLKSFGDLPVICALNKEQLDKPPFNEAPPPNWEFTKPNDRVRDYKHVRMYIGHKLSFDFLTGSEIKLMQSIEQIRNNNDGLRWVFSGHTHHQIFVQTPLVNFINPGAVENSFDGYEYAIINAENHEIVFCRIPKAQSTVKTFSVGVISDSLDISRQDPAFWPKLVKEMQDRDVKHIVHCGNIAMDDIGLPVFADFTVYCYLRPDQVKPKVVPANWHMISANEPVVPINGYKIYVQLYLGAELMEKSEYDMHKMLLQLSMKHPEITHVFCGLTRNASMEENEHHIRIINPGDIVKDGNFAVVCLPREEITFGHVPIEPLPPLK